ncbi:MAG: hypothetical protein KF915_07055 [Polyangiaceae bacterium]|nr:hypothetical protein [Polyangiaceae bacterium]
MTPAEPDSQRSPGENEASHLARSRARSVQRRLWWCPDPWLRGSAPPMRVGILLNPNSRKNRREARSGRKETLAAQVGALGEVIETHHPDELPAAIERLLSQGVEYLVCDGGDGALHWTLNLLRELRGDRGLIPLLPTSGGTIDFVAHKVGSFGNQDTILDAFLTNIRRGRAPQVVEIDSLRLTGETAAGAPFDRLGFALAAGGAGQRFFDQYYAVEDPRAATIVTIVGRTVLGHAAQLLKLGVLKRYQEHARALFEPTEARVTLDGEELPTTRHGALHAGAFDISLGGVFRVFPLAAPDGRLHFQAGAISPREMIRAIPALVRGGAIQSEQLRERSGTEMIIEALGDELLAPIIDGEQFQGLKRLTVTPGPRVPIVRVSR